MTGKSDTAADDFNAVRRLSVPLAEKLAEYYARLEVRKPSVGKAYQSMIDRLIAAGAGSEALTVGDVLPPFLLPDETGKLVNSQALLASGPLVISFNRGHWCTFCQLELLALNEIYDDVRKRGGEIVSITPQRAVYMSELRNSWKIRFPFLSDIDNGYTLTNGLVISIDDAVSQAYAEAGIDLPEFQASDGYFLPIPATYVVASDNKVIATYVEPDFRKRMSPDDVIKALDGLAAG